MSVYQWAFGPVFPQPSSCCGFCFSVCATRTLPGGATNSGLGPQQVLRPDMVQMELLKSLVLGCKVRRRLYFLGAAARRAELPALLLCKAPCEKTEANRGRRAITRPWRFSPFSARVLAFFRERHVWRPLGARYKVGGCAGGWVSPVPALGSAHL